MRYLAFILLASSGLTACSHSPSQDTVVQTQIISTLDPVNFEEKPSFIASKLDQYKVAGFSLGSWVNQEPGQYFKLINLSSMKYFSFLASFGKLAYLDLSNKPL